MNYGTVTSRTQFQSIDTGLMSMRRAEIVTRRIIGADALAVMRNSHISLDTERSRDSFAAHPARNHSYHLQEQPSHRSTHPNQRLE